jgi:hypothetical protein
MVKNKEKEDKEKRYFKWGYNEANYSIKGNDFDNLKKIYKENPYLKSQYHDPRFEGWALGVLNKEMQDALKKGNFEKGLDVAGMYFKVEGGVRDSVKRQLKKLSKQSPWLAEDHKSEIEKYFKAEKPKREKLHAPQGLETKFMLGIIITFLIASSFFLSPAFTGNVIGNIDTSSSNIISAILLVLAIAGFAFLKKR